MFYFIHTRFKAKIVNHRELSPLRHYAHHTLFELFSKKIWWVQEMVVPLQSLSANGGIAQSVRASDS